VLAETYFSEANGKSSDEMPLEVKSVDPKPPEITSRSVREAESSEAGFNAENMFGIVGHSVLDIVLRVDDASLTVLDVIVDQSLDGIPHARFFI
jgi:hypothetical protein